MKIIVHFCVFIQCNVCIEIEDFLKEKLIVYKKTDFIDGRKIVSFDIFESDYNYDSVFSFMQIYKPIVTKQKHYTDEELNNAQWLSMLCFWGKIDMDSDSAYESTFSDFCTVCKIQEQIGPYRISKAPLWKKSKNFCADSSGGWDKIFCSSEAKKVIEENGIRGVGFKNVLKHKTSEPIEDLYQLNFKTVVDPFMLDLKPVPAVQKCEHCGKIVYRYYDDLQEKSFKSNQVIEDIDAFIIPVKMCGCEFVIISNKFYKVLKYTLKDKTLKFEPIQNIGNAGGIKT